MKIFAFFEPHYTHYICAENIDIAYEIASVFFDIDFKHREIMQNERLCHEIPTNAWPQMKV